MDDEFLKEHKEEKSLKSVLDKIVKYREEETDMNGLEVLERNYNIMQLEKCIIDSGNKTDLDENISNFTPVYSPFEFFLKLKKRRNLRFLDKGHMGRNHENKIQIFSPD